MCSAVRPAKDFFLSGSALGYNKRWEMRPDTFISTIYQSLYSRTLYRDVALKWKGIGLAYLILLLSLHWIPEIMKVQREVAERLDSEAPHYISQVPLITITKGKAFIKEKSPYYIYEPDNKTVFAVIDISGGYALTDNSTTIGLLTETRLIAKNNITGYSSIDLSQVDKLVVDRKLLYEWLDEFKDIFAYMMYPFALFFSFIFHVFQVLIGAFIGRLFCRMNNIGLDFRALMRLSAVVCTPPVLLQTAHTLLGATFFFAGPISFIIMLGFLYYAVQACVSKETGVNKFV